MGCDIHFYVERRAVPGDASYSWVTCDEWNNEGNFEDGDYWTSSTRWYQGRSYSLFSILANVRNGWGFAGVQTGDGFVPIVLPRGVPEDASPEYLRVVEQWSGDGHSHSWLTVAELLEYDWTQKTRRCGMVTLDQWARWRRTGRPQNWAGSVSGPAVVHMEEAEVARVLGEPSWELVRGDGTAMSLAHERLGHTWQGPRMPGGVYVSVDWEVLYYEQAADFLSSTMPRLWRLGAPDDVRCVFFFDN